MAGRGRDVDADRLSRGSSVARRDRADDPARTAPADGGTPNALRLLRRVLGRADLRGPDDLVHLLLGRRVFGREDIGLAAAVFVAISPAFLAHMVSPLSDVPATALATLALVLLIAEQPVPAGLATAAAIAIRPNLAPLSLALLAWTALRDAQRPQPRHFFARSTVRMAIGIAPAIIAIAWLNVHLYGSPLQSGYGEVRDLCWWRHLWTNVVHFSTWTSQSDTPIVALALAFFVAPARLPPVQIPFARVLLGGVVAIVILSYVFYLPFEHWGYLRFLLPMWPVVMVLTAASITAVADRWLPRHIRHAALALLLGGLAWHHLTFAVREHVFSRWQYKRTATST